MAITAPEAIRISGPANREFRRIRIVEGFGGAAHDLFEIGAAPSRLQQQIVRPPQRQQPAFDGVLRVLGAGHVAQALRGNGADRRQRVLDAVVQFFQDQLLQLVGRRALAGVDAGLIEQFLGVDFRLRQQQPKADILRREKVLRRRCAIAEMALVLVMIDFEHPRP